MPPDKHTNKHTCRNVNVLNTSHTYMHKWSYGLYRRDALSEIAL